MKWSPVLLCLVGFALAGPLKSFVDLQDTKEPHPGEFGDYFEGDIVLPRSRTGQLAPTYRWPNNTLVYAFAPSINETQRVLVNNTLRLISDGSCLRFVNRTTEKDYVLVVNNKTGCFSSVGRQRGVQILHLENDGCFKQGTIAHEFLHALGFWHAQSAYNRDDYVTINWENIKKGKEHNFSIKPNTTTTMFDLPYDYGSVMHYPGTAFSKNGNFTIVPKEEGVEIGQRRGLSGLDFQRLNRMYNCTTGQ
ncbi:Metalloendopeptidase [Sergentomyia squamirostris]